MRVGDGGGIGRLLREWRGHRKKSQLALALDANVSARHVSFVESGRARPSRDMVLRLTEVLDVPFRDRNLFLAAAGFAPVFRESPLAAAEMGPIRVALERILDQHEPHPAVVMDRYWNILSTNNGADRLFSSLIDITTVARPANVLRLMFDPAGVRPFVENWPEVARSLLARVRREAVCGVPDPGLTALVEELGDYPGMADTPLADPLLPIIPVRFRKGDFTAAYFSTVTTLGTPVDVTLQEIRIECFFPAGDG